MQTLDTLLTLLLDTNLPSLEGFALDHADALAALGGFGIDDVEITQLSAARIEAAFGDNTLVLSGGQIDPVGSVDDLLKAIDTAFADASLTQLQLSDTTGVLVSFELTENGFIISSGEQALKVVGNWPASLEEISRMANLLTEVQNVADLTRDDRSALTSLIKSYDLSRATLTDAGQEVFKYMVDGATVSVSSNATSLSVTEGREGDAKTFALQLSGDALDPVSSFEISGASLTNLPYTIPEIIEEIGLDYTQAEIDRTVLLGDHTYITYALEQSILGDYTFDLNIKVDEYYTDSIASTRR